LYVPGRAAPAAFEAPWLLEARSTATASPPYVGRFCCPLSPANRQSWNNLAVHRGKDHTRLIRFGPAPSCSALPKYSPDLTRSNRSFQSSKHLLRKAAARTAETVCAAIGELLGAFTSDECANYFKNSGYAPN
jgi:hypothetical protein